MDTKPREAIGRLADSASTIIQPFPAPAVCPWTFFDRIYCITLAQRQDRRQIVEQQFQSVNLGEKVEYVVVDKHPTNSEQGIYESHLSCLRAGLAAGARTIMVFEDDVEFRPGYLNTLGDCVRFLNADSQWQLFFLGCFVNSSRQTDYPSVLHVRFRCAAHAYAIQREFAEQIVGQPWRGVAYDDILRDMNLPQVFAAYPGLAFQSNSATDNDKARRFDRMRRPLGGMRRLQRWNEFSTRHFRKLVAVHVLAAVVCVLLLLLYRIPR